MSTRIPGLTGVRQHGVDGKAFKGKGEVVAQLKAIHEAMGALSGESKDVPGKTVFLELHRRHQTGQVSLRWRAAFGNWRHLDWADVQGLLQGRPLEWVEFYARLQSQAEVLNAREIEARQAVRRQL